MVLKTDLVLFPKNGLWRQNDEEIWNEKIFGKLLQKSKKDNGNLVRSIAKEMHAVCIIYIKYKVKDKSNGLNYYQSEIIV